MILEIEKKTKEKHEINLATPVYSHYMNRIFYKFCMNDDKIQVISCSTALYFTVSVREFYDDDIHALLHEDGWVKCTEEEFKRELNKNLKLYNLT